MLQHQRRDPDVVDGNGRALSFELELEIRVETRHSLVASEHLDPLLIEELHEEGLVSQ
jgi:hypothetical protein